ncbi:PREDICTED: uncharacterized protein LOC108380301 [Rhagoletis zephyria]|uniref:uncharacterized protein LOC108380301 n=1 Tax=Rhagoletis zephyria TaxID=28612 RepID=UPI000811A03C|nr:PREDICTED: uncharacterized protein LOC108380301 [Rhagoletis zephyria]
MPRMKPRIFDDYHGKLLKDERLAALSSSAATSTTTTCVPRQSGLRNRNDPDLYLAKDCHSCNTPQNPLRNLYATTTTTITCVQAADGWHSRISYERLDRKYERCLCHDIKIVLCDLNVKVSKEGIFCLVLGSSRFQHKKVHPSTYMSVF